MSKPTTVVEIPRGASDQVFRLLMEDITKAVRTARAVSKKRITIVISQEQ